MRKAKSSTGAELCLWAVFHRRKGTGGGWRFQRAYRLKVDATDLVRHIRPSWPEDEFTVVKMTGVP